MAELGAVEAIEIERKYEVAESAVLPGLETLSVLRVPDAVTGHPSISEDTYRLRATYFDTPDGQLGQHRVAVRCRKGGSDAGWHLKTKHGDYSRELMWPLSESMPTGLVDAVTELIGAAALAQLRPIADLQTQRHIMRWAPDETGWVIEIADDTVQGTNELTGITQTWREWEAELAPGADAAWLDQLEPLLLAAGAKRVLGTSKLQRVMGRPAQIHTGALPTAFDTTSRTAEQA